MSQKLNNSKKRSYTFALLSFFIIGMISSITSIAQTTPKAAEKVMIGQNVLRFVITKDTKDTQLDIIKQKLAEKKITIEFNDLVRNATKEITGIKIDYASEKNNGNHFVNSEKPINDIEITYNLNENEMTVGSAKTTLSQTFKVLKDDDNADKLEKSKGENVFVFSSEDQIKDENKVVVIDKNGEKQVINPSSNVLVIKSKSDSETEVDDVMIIKRNKNGVKSTDTIRIKKDTDKIIWTDEEGNDIDVIVSEDESHKVEGIQSEGSTPLFILDGKEITQDEMSRLNTNTIDSVNVFKDESAIKIYGNKGKSGVVVITTKKIEHGDNSSLNSEENHEAFLIMTITKNTTKEELDAFKSKLKEQNITAKFFNTKRNDKGEIIRINVELKNKNGSEASSAYSNDEGITDIAFGTKKDQLFVHSIKSKE